MDLFFKSLFVLLLCTALMAGMIKLGIFSHNAVALGFNNYAEKIQVKGAIKMPVNAVVNLGYVLVGFYWIFNGRRLNLSRVNLFYLDVFSIIALIYGPIQLARIVTQRHQYAILDQWIVLPFFSWIYIWGYHFLNDMILTRFKLIAIMVLSLVSYKLTAITSYGYAIIIAYHILLAMLAVVSLQKQHGNNMTLMYIFYGVLLLFGFIGFKRIDFQLVKVHSAFRIISGHFLSRLCGVFTVHISSLYFVENVRLTHDQVD